MVRCFDMRFLIRIERLPCSTQNVPFGADVGQSPRTEDEKGNHKTR
jgi:hypothetical protein